MSRPTSYTINNLGDISPGVFAQDRAALLKLTLSSLGGFLSLHLCLFGFSLLDPISSSFLVYSYAFLERTLQ